MAVEPLPAAVPWTSEDRSDFKFMRDVDQRRVWADSGGLWLTGWPEGPVLGPPRNFVPRLAYLGGSLAARSERVGHSVGLDPLSTLTARAALREFRRGGRTSCGGGTHLFEVADGWLAVALARPDDVDLIPAWLEVPGALSEPEWLADAVRRRPLQPLVDRAAMLGLAVGGTPERATIPLTRAPLITELGPAEPIDSLDGLIVLDLGSLWAAPLCTAILAQAGATVVKVESTDRPDGARRDPSGFFDLLNAGKRSVAIDFAEPEGRAVLAEMIARADVVVESSRPRAMRQLGIDVATVLREQRPRVWMSITGHGRSPQVENRVGFGDDAAVSAGLLGWNDAEPCFVADAVADPITGMVAADVVLELLTRETCCLADVSLAATAARFAGDTSVEHEFEPTPPPLPRLIGTAAELGSNTADVLDEMGLG